MIGLFFGGLLKRLIASLTALLGIIRAHPWQCAVIALLAVSAWMWRGKANALDERDAARAETASLIVSYKQAQIEAEAAQIAANTANVQTQIERNKGITNAGIIAETARAGAVADYIRANRLRPQGACRPASGAIAPGLHPDTAEPADAGPVADVVAVSPADLDTLTSGAMRGASCTGFLNTLIAEGLGAKAE